MQDKVCNVFNDKQVKCWEGWGGGPGGQVRLATQEEANALPNPYSTWQMLETGTEVWASPNHVKIDPITTILDDETKTEYKKVAERAKARTDVTVQAIEALEDQLCDIQTSLDSIAENTSYGTDDYWNKQVIDLTKLYLQDMVARRRELRLPLTEQDLVKMVSSAANIATKSIKAIKEQVNAA